MRRTNKISFLLILLAVFGLGLTSAFGQASAKPSKTVSDFYNWYLNDKGSFENSTKIKTFVTAKLFNKAKKNQVTADGNFYTNEAAGATVSPGKAKILSEKMVGYKSFVTVLLKSTEDYSNEPDIITEIKLKITLVKEKSVWKIDDIE